MVKPLEAVFPGLSGTEPVDSTPPVPTQQVLPSSTEGNGSGNYPPNQAMLNALAEVKRIQTGMQPKEDKHGRECLQEARSGGMYSYGGDETGDE
jgi:hypothetical protein